MNWKSYNYLLDKLTAYEDKGFDVELIAYGDDENECKGYPTDDLIKDHKIVLHHYYKKYGNIYRIVIKNPEINRIVVANEHYYMKLLSEFYSKIESRFEWCPEVGASLIIKDKH